MPMDEDTTRKRLIDAELARADWAVGDVSRVATEYPIDLVRAGVADRVSEPRGPYDAMQFADYALLRAGRVEAVVEAKRTSRNVQIGQEQALQYSQNIQRLQGGEAPFVLYTNGHEVRWWEAGFYPPAKVHGYPTPRDLEWLAQRRRDRHPLSAELIDTRIVERDYQIEAIRTVLDGIEQKRQKFLLVMATGTGKTRTLVALADVLLRARWARRVLFLVDRLALQEQALDAFKEFMPAEPRWPTADDGSEFVRTRRIYVTTYPTMLHLIERGTTPGTYLSPFFFDLVVADESHRSIYDVYRSVLDYFHGLRVGLTATPTDRIDHDTFQLFECPTHDPTFAYTYEDAIAHAPPYLCGFQVLKVRSKFQLEGIHGKALSPEEQRRLVADGQDVEAIDFEGTDLERKVTNSGTNALIVREFMEESIKDGTGTLPGKSIIFAITKAHAYRLQEMFDAMYPEHAGRLAKVLVSEDSRVHGKGGLLDQFKNCDMPRVAISVDMLDTGVDVREVVNLVFAKPVYSFVKFWQMLGRGTRVLEVDPAKRKPWCPEKDTFLVFDCWGNFEYFQMHPEGREPGAQVPLPVRLFRARLDELEAGVAAGKADVVARVVADLQGDLARLPENNVVVMDSRAVLSRVADPGFWTALDIASFAHLRQRVAPVLRARTQGDFKAMGFELDCVEAAGARLAGNDATFAAAQQAIAAQITELPLSVNVVAAEREIIEATRAPAWWAAADDAKLRDVAARLGPLMRYRTQRTGGLVELRLEDALVLKETIEFGPQHERLKTSVYRERVEARVRQLAAENPILGRLAAGEAITADDERRLADLLEPESITADRLQKAYDARRAGFVQLLRHALGLEALPSWSAEVMQAFEGFLVAHTTLSSAQIRFLLTVRSFVLQRGRIEKRDLIAEPFTRLHPDGVRGLFRDDEIAEILALASRVAA